ncbi:MAG: preprotein translocase subunit SecE, partial [Solirubrobacteraceae bacterium]
PQPVPSARAERERAEREETPDPIAHGTPDVELAEAQLALGRPELSGDDAADEDLAYDGDLESDSAAAPDELEELPRSGSRRSSIPGVAGVTPRVEQGSAGGGSVGDAALPAPRNVPGNRLVRFLQGSWHELQRVQWPDRRQTMQATGVVIGFVIVAGVFLGVADFLAGKIVDYILK